jgi:hypothetical protein
VTLLRISADGLAAFAGHGNLGDRLAEQMLHATGRRPAPSERRSWTMSLPVLARDLLDAGLGDVEVLVEHHLPLTSQRVDAVLAGFHPLTGEPSFVVVELKQWTSARPYEGSPTLVEVDGMRGGPKLHPVLQVRGYCQYIADFCLALAHLADPLAGIAYLHNASDDGTFELGHLPSDRFGRLFTAQRRAELLGFLKQRLDPGRPGAEAADLLVNSAVGPSKQLLAVAAEEIREREQFVLLDNQRLAYELVLHEVERRGREDAKSIIVVFGGPGSGKSVIALSLLGELARQGRTVLHATGSRSFTQTLRKVVGKGSARTKNLFKYFNQFMDAERNSLDVLVLDEAHRIRETSVDRWTKARYRTGRPQIDELVAAARVPVFLLDEHQTVRPGELGSLSEIQAYADQRQLTVHKISLDEQFRCGGSEEYIDWIQKLLGLVDGGAEPWRGDPSFAVIVAETPSAMESMLERRIEDNYKARMSAGYCWPWSDPDDDGSLVPDVHIDDWSRPWNLKGDRSVGGAPPAALWATEPEGFHQVGCVYTAQGFEYDWAGVILGPDLVWRDGGFVSRREYNRDPDFRSRARVPDEEFDRLVRNVYKVLLTRGMIGAVLYSSDEQTREALRHLVNGELPDGDRQTGRRDAAGK